MITDLRNADAMTLLTTLQELDARKMDVIHPANSMRVVNGQLVLTDVLTDQGAWQKVTLSLTDTFVQGLASKLNIPIAYLRRCLAESDERNRNAVEFAGAVKFDRDPIFDQTVNYWLAQQDGNVLVRAYAGDEGTGIARAFLSDRFLTLDHLDAATAVLQADTESGVNAQLVGADLTDRNMWMKFRCPDIHVHGGDFTENYTLRRGGHTMLHGKDRPLIFGGFIVENSETGAGKARVAPRLEVEVCTNGLRRNIDERGFIHIGSVQDQGVRWSKRTTDTRIELIKAEMADAVTHFMTTEYVQGVVDEINGVATVEIAHPEKATEHVIKAFNMPQERREALFAAFMGAGPSTVGSMVQAMTQLAQETDSAADANDLESAAEKVLGMADVLAKV